KAQKTFRENSESGEGDEINKARTWTLLGIGIIVGIVLGLGAMALIPKGEEDASQIENAQLKVGDVAPDFRLPDHT
ncbi:MAG: hypothetical protein V3S14_13050, partial [Anaerolineae bacterium]